jgi:hypothetical protein
MSERKTPLNPDAAFQSAMDGMGSLDAHLAGTGRLTKELAGLGNGDTYIVPTDSYRRLVSNALHGKQVTVAIAQSLENVIDIVRETTVPVIVGLDARYHYALNEVFLLHQTAVAGADA